MEPATSFQPLESSAEAWFLKADRDYCHPEKAGEDLALRDQSHSKLCLTVWLAEFPLKVSIPQALRSVVGRSVADLAVDLEFLR